MKYFLVFLVAVFGLAAHADEDSARSSRSSENSPVTTSIEGQGPATNADFPKAKSKTKGTDMILRNHKMDSVCEAEGNPEDCYDKTSARNKKKKAAMKKKVLSPESSEQK